MTEQDDNVDHDARLRFVLSAAQPASGKTSAWCVIPLATGNPLGRIKWYAPWRRYVFEPYSATLYDASCLLEIITFINLKMDERKRDAY